MGGTQNLTLFLGSINLHGFMQSCTSNITDEGIGVMLGMRHTIIHGLDRRGFFCHSNYIMTLQNAHTLWDET